MDRKIYVSTTGLKLKSFIHAPRFWRHAIASMKQARGAEGCLSAQARTINGIHHTLTTWTSKRHMRAYLSAGAHRKAMRIYRSIAEGKVHGCEAEQAPNLESVHEIWQKDARPV